EVAGEAAQGGGSHGGRGARAPAGGTPDRQDRRHHRRPGVDVTVGGGAGGPGGRGSRGFQRLQEDGLRGGRRESRIEIRQGPPARRGNDRRAGVPQAAQGLIGRPSGGRNPAAAGRGRWAVVRATSRYISAHLRGSSAFRAYARARASRRDANARSSARRTRWRATCSAWSPSTSTFKQTSDGTSAKGPRLFTTAARPSASARVNVPDASPALG